MQNLTLYYIIATPRIDCSVCTIRCMLNVPVYISTSRS
jgi:hypothetical protein